MADQRITRLIEELLTFFKESKEQGTELIFPTSVEKIQKIKKSLERPINSDSLSKNTIRELEKVTSLARLERIMAGCQICDLHKHRKSIVFGEGTNTPCLMVVGEAPGREEDLKGRPFVGKSGELLTKMLRAIHIERSEVFITSVVKCRPDNNRTPTNQEINACLPYLKAQIRLLAPKIILCLGHTAAKAILETDQPLSKLRGQIFKKDQIDIIVTYHPAFLLRFSGIKQKAYKKQAWHDLQMLSREYERHGCRKI